MAVPGTGMCRLCTMLALFAGCAAFDASAQGYPAKPVRLVVGFTPGGVADAIGRLLAQHLSPVLGQTVVVENRGGASGAIAYDMVAKSAPDGYTLLVIGNTAAVLPALRANLPYDLERDLGAVSLVAVAPFVLVLHPSVPARNVRELVELAQSRPGKLSYGSVGAGSSPHLTAELFKTLAKVDIVHVPYKGGGDNAVANAAGQIEMSFLSIPSQRPFASSGKLRPLAVTSARRSSFLPDLPTIHESGLPGYDYSSWNGIVGPAGMPRDILVRINATVATAVATADMREGLNRQGLEPRTNTPEEFAAYIHREVVQNAKLVKASGLKVE